VTAPTAFGRRHVVGALAGFLRRYPDIEVDLHLIDQIVDLSEQRMDVAIRIGLLPDSDLRATTLAQVRLVTCASPAYLEKFGTPATPLDLLGHNCMTFIDRAMPPYWWAFEGANRNRALPVRGNMRCDDVDFMLDAAIGGAGIAHMASWLAADAICSGQLVALFGPPDKVHETAPGGIHAVRLPGRSHPVKAQLFIDYLRAYVGTPPYWESALARHTQQLSPGN